MKSNKKHLYPIIVGVTGGIGSGKSTICRVFEWLGIPIYYSDSAAKRLINENKKIKGKIVEIFGPRGYDSKGKYNSSYIAKKVFSNKSLLKILNEIVHPEVAIDFDRWVKKNRKYPYIIKEAAILFESGAYKDVDKVICVTAPMELRLERIQKRDDSPKAEIKKRMDSQWSENKKIKLSDFVIKNDEKQSLVDQIIKIHNILIKK